MTELKPCPFCGENVAVMTDAHDLEECSNFEDDNCHCNFRKFVAKTFDVHIDWRDCWIQDCKLTREEAEKALKDRE